MWTRYEGKAAKRRETRDRWDLFCAIWAATYRADDKRARARRSFHLETCPTYPRMMIDPSAWREDI